MQTGSGGAAVAVGERPSLTILRSRCSWRRVQTRILPNRASTAVCHAFLGRKTRDCRHPAATSAATAGQAASAAAPSPAAAAAAATAIKTCNPASFDGSGIGRKARDCRHPAFVAPRAARPSNRIRRVGEVGGPIPSNRVRLALKAEHLPGPSNRAGRSFLREVGYRLSGSRPCTRLDGPRTCIRLDGPRTCTRLDRYSPGAGQQVKLFCRPHGAGLRARAASRACHRAHRHARARASSCDAARHPQGTRGIQTR
jgi:hypothetical protein